MCEGTIVCDRAVCRAVELNDWHIIPARLADRLNPSVYRLDRVRVETVGVECGYADIRIIRTRVHRESCNLRAHNRITRQNVRQTTAVAVTDRENTSCIDTVAGGHIGDKCRNESNVVDARAKAWIGFPGIANAGWVDRYGVRILHRIIEMRHSLYIRATVALTVECEYQW